MAKWFRSSPMEYISIIMNEDAAHDCLADLGKLGVIQFTDVSSFFLCYTGSPFSWKCSGIAVVVVDCVLFGTPSSLLWSLVEAWL
jgi:hypothetical protein